MITASVALSIILMIVAAIHISLGGYSLYLDSRSQMNKIFFLTTLALFVWAFSFSIAIASPAEHIVFFWRRIAAVGWGSFYCLMLHFILILTLGQKTTKAKEDRFTELKHAVLYLPAFVTIFVFSISEKLTRENYNLVNTYLGWRNLAVHSVWDSFFNTYYISYSIVGLLLVLWWSRKSGFTRERKQASLIVITLFIAFFLGSTTDIILDYFTNITLPELGVVFLAIPMTAILYSIKKYRLMSLTPSHISEDILKNMNDGLILVDHRGVIQMVNPSCCKLIGVGDEELTGLNMKEILSEKDEFACSNEEYKRGNCSVAGREILVAFRGRKEKPVLFSAAPITDEYDDLVGIVCILTDLSEIKQREDELKIARENLEARVRERTGELSDVNELQRILLEISTDCISITERNFNEKIMRVLDRIGTFIGADRAYGFRIDNQDQTISLAYEWYKNDSILRTGDWDRFPISKIQWAFGIFVREKCFLINGPNALPPEAKEEARLVSALQIKSFLAIPVGTPRETTGFIAFDTVHEYKQWNEGQINMLKLLANILSDGVSRLQSEQEINHLAFYDHLTGLPNRTEFIRGLNEKLKNAERLCVLFIDLDNFKAINDTTGHNGGNTILRSAAERLLRVIEPVGELSRIGGDEFIACINRFGSSAEIEQVAASILELFAQPFAIENERFVVTVSIGVSFFPDDGDCSDELIRNADLAMYDAKAAGKNRFRICTDFMKDQAWSKNQMINLLQNAIDHNELMIQYQPQVSFLTGKISGAEALLRWNSAELGMIPPGTFIPLAEKHGSINKIGMWVLHRVCEQIKLWREKGIDPVTIGVNVSIEQLKEADFVEETGRLLAEFDIDENRLEFEITESVAMNEMVDVIEKLRQLKNLGIHISIDDFGSDYSSLRRLKELPIDRIKVDMGFIKDISYDPMNQAILKAIIQLAKDLRLQVIAEGVETEAELKTVKDLNCEEVQGFYFYRPMPAEELEKLFS